MGSPAGGKSGKLGSIQGIVVSDTKIGGSLAIRLAVPDADWGDMNDMHVQDDLEERIALALNICRARVLTELTNRFATKIIDHSPVGKVVLSTQIIIVKVQAPLRARGESCWFYARNCAAGLECRALH